MSAAAFIAYASSSDLNSDEIYTIELLIERVRSKFDPNYWDHWSERSDAREKRGYKPGFSRGHVLPAAEELQSLSWMSFQRLRDSERPVRDLHALRYLPTLSGLVLINNDVSDIGPLRHCSRLAELHLAENPVRDISPLAGCLELEKLILRKAPIKDFSVLQLLPKLAELEISGKQIARFRQVARLPFLRKLDVGLDQFDSFDGFPEMPELRVIRGAKVSSLDGLQRFPKLENLVNLSGKFNSLEPLRGLKRLTHANITASRVKSLEPLSGLVALRSLWMAAASADIDLTALESLPALHEATVECNGYECDSLTKLKAELSSWDVEFYSETPRSTPSLDTEVVDEETFDYYDSKQPFGLTEVDTNIGLLTSELEWVDEKIEEVFAVDFKADDDYSIPFRWNEARSRTVVLHSERAIEAFPRLVLGIQNVLAHANNDWIIYFQSENEEFIVWVYPQKIVATVKYADNVRRLIEPH